MRKVDEKYEDVLSNWKWDYRKAAFQKKSSNCTSFELEGIQVKFPFKPYDIQKDYMSSVLKAWSNKQNALLESPTGTGKTLSLLWASLAWLDGKKWYESEIKRPKIIYSSRTHSQLSQVVNELKNTVYSPRTAVLGSRDHLCINEELESVKGEQRNKACYLATNIEIDEIVGHKLLDAEDVLPWEADQDQINPDEEEWDKNNLCYWALK
jgi:Rad3-related DNA helicase